MNRKCEKCIHKYVCKDVEKMDQYLKEMTELDKKYDEFAKAASIMECLNYINEKAVNKHYHNVGLII